MRRALLAVLIALPLVGGAADGPPPTVKQPVIVADQATARAFYEAGRKLFEGWDQHPDVLPHNNYKLSAYNVGERWLFNHEEFEIFTEFVPGNRYWEQNGALDIVVAIDRACRAAGVELIVTIAPARTQLYPELIPELREVLAPFGGQPVFIPTAQNEFLAELRARGVNAIDLVPIFLAWRGRYNADFTDVDYPVYGGHGQHWVAWGAWLAAMAFREVVKDRPWYQQAEKVPQPIEWRVQTGDRALARQHQLHKRPGVPFEFHKSYGPHISRVQWGPYTEETTPIALAGDSFVGAELGDLIHGVFGIPVMTVNRNQMYNSQSIGRLMSELKKNPGAAASKKLIIWEMIGVETHQKWHDVSVDLPGGQPLPPTEPTTDFGPLTPELVPAN